MTSYLKKKKQYFMHNCYFFLSFSSSFSFMGHTLRNDMKDELNEQKQNCRRNCAWHAEEGGNGQ